MKKYLICMLFLCSVCDAGWKLTNEGMLNSINKKETYSGYTIHTLSYVKTKENWTFGPNFSHTLHDTTEQYVKMGIESFYKIDNKSSLFLNINGDIHNPELGTNLYWYYTKEF